MNLQTYLLLDITVIRCKLRRSTKLIWYFSVNLQNTYCASDKTKTTNNNNNTKQTCGLALLCPMVLVDFPMDFKLQNNHDSLQNKNYCRFVIKITTVAIRRPYTVNMGKQQTAKGEGRDGGERCTTVILWVTPQLCFYYHEKIVHEIYAASVKNREITRQRFLWWKTPRLWALCFHPCFQMAINW